MIQKCLIILLVLREALVFEMLGEIDALHPCAVGHLVTEKDVLAFDTLRMPLLEFFLAFG